MINEPIVICQSSLQLAWQIAVAVLLEHRGRLHNLIVQITDPTSFDDSFHQRVLDFCEEHSVLGPKHTAYTIFPYKLYATRGSATELFTAYNRKGGLYERLRSRPRSSWGTYFRRMTHYESSRGIVNQLQAAIEAINRSDQVHKAAYTVLIQKPGGETVRRLGSPCLNYLAIQMEHTTSRPLLGLLCVYRNQDFLERAYGNYWGLCNLAQFLAKETNSIPGPVTCVSSHAYVNRLKRPLRSLLATL